MTDRRRATTQIDNPGIVTPIRRSPPTERGVGVEHPLDGVRSAAVRPTTPRSRLRRGDDRCAPTRSAPLGARSSEVNSVPCSTTSRWRPDHRPQLGRAVATEVTQHPIMIAVQHLIGGHADDRLGARGERRHHLIGEELVLVGHVLQHVERRDEVEGPRRGGGRAGRPPPGAGAANSSGP